MPFFFKFINLFILFYNFQHISKISKLFGYSQEKSNLQNEK